MFPGLSRHTLTAVASLLLACVPCLHACSSAQPKEDFTISRWRCSVQENGTISCRLSMRCNCEPKPFTLVKQFQDDHGQIVSTCSVCTDGPEHQSNENEKYTTVVAASAADEGLIYASFTVPALPAIKKYKFYVTGLDDSTVISNTVEGNLFEQ